MHLYIVDSHPKPGFLMKALSGLGEQTNARLSTNAESISLSFYLGLAWIHIVVIPAHLVFV